MFLIARSILGDLEKIRAFFDALGFAALRVHVTQEERVNLSRLQRGIK